MATTYAPPAEEITQTRLPAASPLRRALGSPWAVGLVALLVYGLSLTAFFASGRDARDFIHMDTVPFHQSHRSTVIKIDPHYRYSSPLYAYDGKWYYFIAADPANARYYVDWPAYRYTKILYPATARALAFGQVDLIPYTMILTNWLAIAGGTLILAIWLRRRYVSPWFALGYALYFGTAFSYAHDLVEPLSYALILLGIYTFDFGSHRRVLRSAFWFALAILARDKSVLFAAVYGLALLIPPDGWRAVVSGPAMRRTVPGATLFFAVAGVPMLMYKLFLRSWLAGSAPRATTGIGGALQSVGIQTTAQSVPFTSLFHALTSSASVIIQGPSVYVPTAVLCVMLVWAVSRRLWCKELTLLAVSIATTVVILNPVYFTIDHFGIVRAATAIVVSALLCTPTFNLISRTRAWLAICLVGWCCFSVKWLLP